MILLNHTPHVFQAGIFVFTAAVWRQTAFACPKAHCPSRRVKSNANCPGSMQFNTLLRANLAVQVVMCSYVISILRVMLAWWGYGAWAFATGTSS